MAGLTTGAATGSQTTTQNPQTATSQSGGPSAQSSGSVQPGTATSLLTSQQGISLNAATPLTTVSLTDTGTQTQSQTAPQPKQHHFNPALIGVSIGLCLIAVGLFFAISRSAKSTTNY